MPDSTGNTPFEMPRTFDLMNPAGWFMTEVQPRIDRKQERMLWRMTWEGPRKPPHQGGTAGGEDSTGAPAKAGEKVQLKELLGPKLNPDEVARAKERAPTDGEGKLLCWGHLTHLGCAQSNCQRSHSKLQGQFEHLDPCVQMQLLRRGGLRRMRVETKDSVTEKIQKLRSGMAADKASKVQDGKDAAGRKQGGAPRNPDKPAEQPKAGGQPALWQAPREMQAVDPTAQESSFAALRHGPDARWLEGDQLAEEGSPLRLGSGSSWRRRSAWRSTQCWWPWLVLRMTFMRGLRRGWYRTRRWTFSHSWTK